MKFWGKFWTSFVFTKGEQIAVYILLIIIGGLAYINHTIKFEHTDKEQDTALFDRLVHERDSIAEANAGKLFCFNPNLVDSITLAQLAIPTRIKTNILNYRAKGGRFRHKEDLKRLYTMDDSSYTIIEPYILIEKTEKNSNTKVRAKTKEELKLFTFNPNTISQDSLMLLDMPSGAKRNLIKYRDAGGVLRNKEKLADIYGMTNEAYLKLYPFVNIDIKEEESSTFNTTAPKESAPTLLIELNSCSAEDLKKLRGIGEVLSKRIVEYRESLGGYYSTEQLREVYNLPKETIEANLRYLKVDTSYISKIDINFANTKELSKHPYIDYKLAKKIISFRSKNGFISDISVLKSQTLSESEYKKIECYLK